MSVLSAIRESKSGPLVIAAAAYLLAMGGELYLRRVSGSDTAEVAGSLLMSAALIVTALVMRAPVFPRWSLLAAAGIFAAGMIVPPLVAPAGSGDSSSLIGTWGYGWLYLILVGGTRTAGPRWCHSPWAVVGSAAVFSLAGVLARGRL